MRDPLAPQPLTERHDQIAILKAISHPVRLLILESLCASARCVNDLQDLAEAPQPNVSQHLSVLKSAGLVGSHANGPLRCYYLAEPTLVRGLLRALATGRDPVHRDREEVIAEAKRARSAAEGGGGVD